jgi:nucleotide-binding universal stress UspA family protein
LGVSFSPSLAEEGSLFFVQEEIFDETPQQAAAVLHPARREIQALGVPAKGAVIEAPRGRVASVIATEATSWGAEAIIVTRRARRALGVLLFGSIADQVTREVSCPVLVARPDRGDPNRHPSL